MAVAAARRRNGFSMVVGFWREIGSGEIEGVEVVLVVEWELSMRERRGED